MSKLKQSIFKGSATALITPFIRGNVDYVRLGSLIDFQIKGGADALVIMGTTGESCSLCEDEQREVLKFSLERAQGRVPMIAGTGSNNISRAIKMSSFASELGYDGLLVVTPYYNKATDKGLIKSYLEIANASKAPIILYNVPTRTCCNISMRVYRELAKHERIVGVKEASGSISAIAELFAECGDSLDVYSGNDDQTLPILSLGGAGVISVLGNILPRVMSKICSLWFEGRIEECRALHLKYLPLMKAMFWEVNPTIVKSAAGILGLCSDELRLPMCEIGDDNRQRLVAMLKKYELI